MVCGPYPELRLHSRVCLTKCDRLPYIPSLSGLVFPSIVSLASLKISSSIPVIFVLVLFLLPVAMSGSFPNASTNASAGLATATNSNHLETRSQIYPSDKQFPTKLVNVYLGYKSEPAPMGIADYGVNQSGAYQYSTSSFLGVVKVNSLSTQDTARDSSMGVQLNINLVFQTSASQVYVY
jgi:hypothetical protein